MATSPVSIMQDMDTTKDVSDVAGELKNVDRLHVSDATKKPEAFTQPSGSSPAWQQFCTDVMVKVESQIMKMIVEERVVVEKLGTGTEPWQYDIIEDSRNYLVYHIVDLVFGLAKHGEKLLQKAVNDARFQALVRFVVWEENDCYLHACCQTEYFSTLANCMMRLSSLGCLANDSDVSEAATPVDPVDALLQFSESKEQPTCDQSHSMETLLEHLETRMKDAELDNDSPNKPMLTRMQVSKEAFKYLLKFEKRLEKLSLAMKSITQQMLQREDGDGKVVTLFGYDIFFVAPTECRNVVDEFFRVQKKMISKYDKDEADAQACITCPDFLPLIKEITCMPKTLLELIDERCKQLGKCMGEMDNKAEDAVLDETEATSLAESSETTEEGLETGKESTEEKESNASKSKETSKSETKQNAGELLNEELDEGIGEGEYIFTVFPSPTERIEYLCPMLGYLPLLPVLRVLKRETTDGASGLNPCKTPSMS